MYIAMTVAAMWKCGSISLNGILSWVRYSMDMRDHCVENPLIANDLIQSLS